MSEGRVNLKRARELLAELGDAIDQSTLSRYVHKYGDVLDPQKDGRDTIIDFDALARHRRENITLAMSSTSSAPAPTPAISKGRADEAAKNIRAHRQLRELEIAERIGALTPTREVQAAAAEALSALRNSFALSLNDTASAMAAALNTEARLVRPHLKAFERNGLDAFSRALLEKLEPGADA